MTAGRIVLILAVLTSSLAWIPSTAQAAPQTETSAAPVIDAWIIGNRLYVEASNLPGKHVFNLRARRDSEEKWTKLSRVKSNRLGDLNKSLRLPNKLTQASRLQVCLKDKKAGQQYCARAWKVE